MNSNQFKEIHIGKIIFELVQDKDFDNFDLTKLLNCDHNELMNMYESESLDASVLLKWSKILDYNLFMFYHTHLQIYSPSSARAQAPKENTKKVYPEFRKNYYSPEIKTFILELIEKKELEIQEIINRYSIPKTTIYRWIKKHNGATNNEVEKKKIIPKINDVNHKRIFKDMLKSHSSLKSTELLDKIDTIENIKDVIAINSEISKHLDSKYSKEMYQSLKSFDKDLISKILKEKKDNNLTTSEIARKYQVSRNTISRWESQYVK
ncbi:MAG: helix-turn-helix domain-containing protein [Flavobacteriales bacterium]|jgi:transposase-like protein|nr:helix-turn-helix domain-containing protein [Flavobacteriales bacterium]